jgi:2-polyprenyl-3-methyl-5-hydroxy-6-metoxy-1,4-benzoquinol methylase
MFAQEARWIADRLAAFPASAISPLIDVGSSTSDFREAAQPWIAGTIFAPLAARGVAVTHLDARQGAGIDICGDLLDDADFAQLRGTRYRALLCCNILEHVRDPAELALRCIEMVMPGGVIVVTVPRSYPRHADPIDTLYRPKPAEMATLFRGTTVLAAEIIDVGQSYRDEVRRRPWILLRHLARLPFPFLDVGKWTASMKKPYWLFHNYQVSAAVLRRDANE